MQTVAPVLWTYEVVAATHKALQSGALSSRDRARALIAFFAVGMLVRPQGMHERPSELAAALKLP